MTGKFDRKNFPFLYAMRGVLAFVFFLIVTLLTSFSIKGQVALASDNSYLKDIPTFAIYILCSVGMLLIFNSTVIAFSSFDKNELQGLLEREFKDLGFFAELRHVLKTPRLLSELITTLVLIALACSLGIFPELGGMFFEASHRSGWFPAVIFTPIAFILWLLSKYEARRWWRKLYREGRLDKFDTSAPFILRLALIFLLYPLVFPLSPLLFMAIYSLFSILISITNALTVIGTIIAVLLVILGVWGGAVLSGIRKRKKFLSELKRVAQAEGYVIYDIRNPYISFVNSKKPCSFDLEYNKKVYNCIVISTLRRGTPLVFTSPTGARFEHRIGTKNHHITINHNIDFYPRGGGSKIIIVDPDPKYVFVTDGAASRKLSTADRIWDITVHNAGSFIGAVDRKCLDRNSSQDR